MSEKLTKGAWELLRHMANNVIESKWRGDDIPGLLALECAGLVEACGQYGWTYRITPAGRSLLSDGEG